MKKLDANAPAESCSAAAMRRSSFILTMGVVKGPVIAVGGGRGAGKEKVARREAELSRLA